MLALRWCGPARSRVSGLKNPGGIVSEGRVSSESPPPGMGHWSAMHNVRALRFAALLLLSIAAWGRAEVRQVTILHLNDLHARLLPDERGLGGFAHVATAIERERGSAANAIVLHAGDMVQGSPVSTIFEGTPVYEVANSLGFDAHCLGNHEFDYGWAQIATFRKTSDAPILSANVRNARGETLVQPAKILHAGGVAIAVVGALTPRLESLIKPEQAGPWRADPLVESLAPVVEEMHGRADMVVVLGHLFDDEDELVLRELEDVDVVVSGHDHGGLDQELVVEGRIGVKLRPYGRELGRLDIWFDTERGRIVRHEWERIPVWKSRYPPQAEAQALVDEWESRVSERVDVDIAHGTRDLGRSEVQELVERAIRETTGADLAYMNRGGVRDSLRRGTIRARHVWNVLPFDNELVEAEVRGRDLPEEFTRGRSVDPNQTYRFVTNDYVSGQWRRSGIEFRPTGRDLRETFLDWVASKERLP